MDGWQAVSSQVGARRLKGGGPGRWGQGGSTSRRSCSWVVAWNAADGSGLPAVEPCGNNGTALMVRNGDCVWFGFFLRDVGEGAT